jgi:IMP cyclohydrolase
MDLFEYLKGNPYPGRGIAVGRIGEETVLAYFIMGRSANSRNRIFALDGGTLFTKAFDESKVEDPSLIIYNAVRSFGDLTVVTNGDQTDTVCAFLEEGRTFEEALATREYEPDGPNWTPRISALVFPDGSSRFSILKKDGESCARLFWDYEPVPGKGRFLSTYATDGSPLPSFEGEPLEFGICGAPEEFARGLWDSLNQDNRVSLYVRVIGADGFRDMTFNKNCGD